MLCDLMISEIGLSYFCIGRSEAIHCRSQQGDERASETGEDKTEKPSRPTEHCILDDYRSDFVV